MERCSFMPETSTIRRLVAWPDEVSKTARSRRGSLPPALKRGLYIC